MVFPFRKRHFKEKFQPIHLKSALPDSKRNKKEPVPDSTDFF